MASGEDDFTISLGNQNKVEDSGYLSPNNMNSYYEEDRYFQT